jgi:radical SAM superfamily enzyme YgiQ (UPF0313 family)
MKITFIKPHLVDDRSSDAMEPLVFAILAGLTPPDVELTLFDERVEDIPEKHETDLVAMTVETYTAKRAYQIASNFRHRGIPVIMGGYHPSFLPDESLNYADSVVIGDAESIWGEIISDAGSGRLQRVYKGSNQSSLNGLIFDRNIFEDKRYTPITPVQFGRGCRFACDFCSIHAFYGSQLRQRSILDVIREIDELDRRFFFFIDDNIFINPTKTEALFRALIPLNIRWTCQVSIDIANHTGLLDLMARSGCIAAVIGFESLNVENLKQMKKKWIFKHSDYETAIQKFRDRGIMIYGTFVFGYDQDTAESFDITVDFALKSKFCLANFNPLTPTPGAKLYDNLRRENRLIFDHWWLDPDYRYGMATFHPRNMTSNELTEGCFRARKKFNQYSSILKRAIDFRTNCRTPSHLGAYLVSNLISRREIFKKQGFQLGSSEPLKPIPEGA